MDHSWEDGKNHPLPQDFADMLGWKELTQKTERFYHSLPDSVQKNTIVFGRHYGHAGAIKFYTKNKQLAANTYTDVGSFLLWIPCEMQLQNILFLSRRMTDEDDEVFHHFKKVTLIDSVTQPYSRQWGDKLIYFQDIDSAGLRLAVEGLNQAKAQFKK